MAFTRNVRRVAQGLGKGQSNARAFSTAKAFVTYTQVYTTLNKSLNVSSVSDDETGVFTITFTNPFTDFRYCKGGASDGGTGTQAVICTYNNSGNYRLTTLNTIGVRNVSDNSLSDRSFNTVMYLGDLA